MLIKRKRGWELRESETTPEAVFRDRRRIVQAMGLGALIAATGGTGEAVRAATAAPDPSAALYPAKRNERYTVDQPITDEKYSTRYNNFYEFSTDKDVDADSLPIRPWTVTIDGMVQKPTQLGIDDLLKRVQLEERVYRHRCVEAWSMVVPWTGFPLKALVDLAEPLGSAKYLRMETFMNPKVAPGQKSGFWFPWPYIEGVTMAEAVNELAFLVTGMYGKPVPRQDGAPLRLTLPWKYGFKSVKSIVKFTFTDQRPVTFWAKAGPSEYGFWANVNPEVPHPRWSQADERVLGTSERRKTQLFNSYGAYVAELYQGVTGERLYM